MLFYSGSLSRMNINILPEKIIYIALFIYTNLLRMKLEKFRTHFFESACYGLYDISFGVRSVVIDYRKSIRYSLVVYSLLLHRTTSAIGCFMV